MKNLKVVRILTLIIAMSILTFVLLLGILETLPFIILFYTPVIFITRKIVLVCIKKFQLSIAALPPLWMFVLGMVMLTVGIPAWFILGTIETDMGYGFVISIIVIAPAIFLTSIGFLLLLIRTAFNWIRKQK